MPVNNNTRIVVDMWRMPLSVVEMGKKDARQNTNKNDFAVS